MWLAVLGVEIEKPVECCKDTRLVQTGSHSLHQVKKPNKNRPISALPASIILPKQLPTAANLEGFPLCYRCILTGLSSSQIVILKRCINLNMSFIMFITWYKENLSTSKTKDDCTRTTPLLAIPLLRSSDHMLSWNFHSSSYPTHRWRFQFSIRMSAVLALLGIYTGISIYRSWTSHEQESIISPPSWNNSLFQITECHTRLWR